MPIESNPNVKLVKSIFMDIVGYSQRNVEWQTYVLSARDELVHASIARLEISQDEVLLNPIGDGLYVALLTGPERFDIHLRLALEILKNLSEHNEQIGGGQQFQLRIGIEECTDNLVRDINGRRNVAGVGANMGARIMNLADGGQILVSQFVHNQLYMRAQYEGKFRDLPVVEVKHGVKLKVFQYVDSAATGLSLELPTEWQGSTVREEQTAVPNRPPSAAQSDVEGVHEQTAEDVFVSEDSESNSSSPEQQITNALAAVSQAARQPEYASGTKFSGDISDFSLLRLQLFATTWLQDQVPSAMLGTHEGNRLYLNRARLELTRPELFSVLRMLVNDSSGYMPGWFWLRAFDSEIIERVILHLAFSDSLAFIRQQAFALLYSAFFPLPEEVEQRFALTVTSDSSPEVRDSAVKYLGRIGNDRHLPIVGSALVDGNAGVRYEAEKSKYLILARSSPNRAFGELTSASGFRITEILKELESGKGMIDSGTLTRALENSNSEIRAFAVTALADRGQLTTEQATALTQDKSESVKAEAYRYLIARGIELDPEDLTLNLPDDRLNRWMSRNLAAQPGSAFDTERMLLDFYRRFGTEELIKMASWSNWAGRSAYRALAIEHFATFGDKVREDIRTRFAAEASSYYNQEVAYWREIESKRTVRSAGATPTFSLFGSSNDRVERTPEQLAESSIDTRRTEYLTAALSGIARNGREDDIPFGRDYLFHSDIDLRIEAVRVVNQFGNADDVDNLTKVATTTDGLLQELSAKGALNLASDPLTVAAGFLQTGDEILVSLTIAQLVKHEAIESSSEFLKSYLYDQRDTIRKRVMLFFVTVLGREALQDLLTSYTRGETYYYDVVCCFDRHLYAPPRLATAYVNSLKELFFGLLDE